MYIASFTLTEALRGKLLWLLAACLLSAIALAEFAGTMSITESGATRAVVFASLLRLGGVFCTILTVAVSISREWQDRSADTLLALPLPRAIYYLGKSLGFVYVVGCISTVTTLGLCLYVSPAQTNLWAVSFFCELNILAAVTMALGTAYHHLPMVLFGSFAFYVLARVIGDVQLLAHGTYTTGAGLAEQFAGLIIDTLAYVIPNLYQFTLSRWLAYPVTGDSIALLWPICIQSTLFCALCIAAGTLDLYRRNL